jgi:4-hydroxy-tetrahydrodipicolinate reductase
MTQAIKIIVNGAQGKMGAMTCQTLDNHTEFDCVARLGRGDNLTTAIKDTKAAIVIDFTNADSVYTNAKTIISSNTHPIIGSSGLLNHQIQELQALCDENKVGGIIAPNFSIGAILMMRLAADSARYFSDVEILETHHQQKIDAPSGTAIKTAQMIAEHLSSKTKTLISKELVPGVRGGEYEGITIHSQRLPGTVAEQQVTFGSQGETLSICHRSINRECFMPGVILACRKVTTLSHLVYGLDNLLE